MVKRLPTMQETWVPSLGQEDPLEKEMGTHSSILSWRIPGQRSLVGCSPWGRTESDMTEQLHFHFSLSCIGEGNGNPLQCSCLENPRDREPVRLPSMGSLRVRQTPPLWQKAKN